MIPITAVFIWIENDQWVLQDYLRHNLPKDWKSSPIDGNFFTLENHCMKVFRPCKNQPIDPYLTQAEEII